MKLFKIISVQAIASFGRRNSCYVYKLYKIIMAFKALFLAHAPDADYEKHSNVIDTGKYNLFTVVVKNQMER